MNTRTKFKFSDLKKKYDIREQEVELSYFTFNPDGESNFPIGNAYTYSVTSGIRGQEAVRNINNPENLEFHPLFGIVELKNKELSDISYTLTSNNFIQDEHNANVFYGEINVSSLVDNPKQIYELTVEGLTEGAEDNIRLVENVEWVIVGEHVDGSLKLKHKSDGNDVVELKYHQKSRNTSVVLESTSWITRSDEHHHSRTDSHHHTRPHDHHTTRTGSHHTTRSDHTKLTQSAAHYFTIVGFSWLSLSWGGVNITNFGHTRSNDHYHTRSDHHHHTRPNDHHHSRTDSHHHSRADDHHHSRNDTHYVTLVETTSVVQTSYIESGVKELVIKNIKYVDF